VIDADVIDGDAIVAEMDLDERHLPILGTTVDIVDVGVVDVVDGKLCRLSTLFIKRSNDSSVSKLRISLISAIKRS